MPQVPTQTVDLNSSGNVIYGNYSSSMQFSFNGIGYFTTNQTPAPIRQSIEAPFLSEPQLPEL